MRGGASVSQPTSPPPAGSNEQGRGGSQVSVGGYSQQEETSAADPRSSSHQVDYYINILLMSFPLHFQDRLRGRI